MSWTIFIKFFDSKKFKSLFTNSSNHLNSTDQFKDKVGCRIIQEVLGTWKTSKENRSLSRSLCSLEIPYPDFLYINLLQMLGEIPFVKLMLTF